MALPVVEYLYGFPAPQPDGYFFNILFDGIFQTPTTTKLVLESPLGRIVFKGDFTVSGGVVTGGTVTGFNVFAGDNTKVTKASGFDISATELVNAINQWQSFNFEPLEQLLLELPTKFIGSELGDFTGAEGIGSVFLGRQGDDELFAAVGDITLKGGKGNDRLFADEGLCWYSGGQGEDVFVFVDPTLPNKIKDFSVEDGDLFALNIFTFIGVGPGLIDDAQFKIGKQASTPEQIIIYQRGKGNVWYDQDGSGSTHDPVKFAKVDKGLDLTAQNFYGEGVGMVA